MNETTSVYYEVQVYNGSWDVVGWNFATLEDAVEFANSAIDKEKSYRIIKRTKKYEIVGGRLQDDLLGKDRE